MSVYTRVDSGVTRYRTLLPTRDRWCGTVDFFRLYGAQTKFLVPGDIWKESVSCFIRLNPMLTPSLTPMSAKIRWFYVPLRLVEPDLTELIITGSKDGKLSEEVLPSFPSILKACLPNSEYEFQIQKDSILHVIFQVPAMGSTQYIDDVDFDVDAKSLPRAYWLKAYCRIWWDYYRDENHEITLETTFNITENAKATYTVDNSDFDSFYDFVSKYAWCLRCLPVMLPKDYFTSALPWQLKGVAPSIRLNIDTGLQWNDVSISDVGNGQNQFSVGQSTTAQGTQIAPKGISYYGSQPPSSGLDVFNQSIQNFLDNIEINPTGSFDVSKLRDMFAQTRVFERLARTGSRYIEYLRANFGTSPSDGTLQRAQYLGGFSQEILTTEVLQTGVGDTPVGTMRGHGISSATNHMSPFHNKEFGMLFCTFEVKPRIQYTQGISRELTYGSRYEFFNPSFQNLSEQEVRNGELFYTLNKNLYPRDEDNDSTFGFQGMYNELRSGKERMFGEMLDTQAQWNQAIKFASAPALNGAFINGVNYADSFLRPFGLAGESTDTKPIIVDLYNVNTPFRPMIRNPTPGLIDHN